MEFLEILKQLCWFLNIVGIVLIFAARLGWHTKVGWAATGCSLLIIAIGNAILLAGAGLNPGQQAASIFGLVALGSMGSRFLGNWITDGAA